MEPNPNMMWEGFDSRQQANYYPYPFTTEAPCTNDLTCPQSQVEDKYLTTVPTQIPHYDVQISIQELLCNRLQWYYVTCKFVSAQGTACCVGQPITFDSRIVFRDGRRRNSQRNTGNDIVLNLWGTCASTGQEVRKCSRCIEKDKVLTQRKRKRDTSLVWNESDDESNSRLIQVLSSGNEVVDASGEVKFRIRIGCCVGVNKQHHLNHISTGDNTVEMHKGCPGLTLSLSVAEKNHTIASVTSQPLRILGKVTTADRKKFGPQSEGSSPSSSLSSTTTTTTSSGFGSLTSPNGGLISSSLLPTGSTISGQLHQQAPKPLQQAQASNVSMAHKHQPQQLQSLMQQHLHQPQSSIQRQQQPQQLQQLYHQHQQPQHQLQPSQMPGMFPPVPSIEPLSADYLTDPLQPGMLGGLPDSTLSFENPTQPLAQNPIISSSQLCQDVNFYFHVDPHEKLYDLALAFRDCFGTIFSTSIPLFSNSFFSASNLRTIPEDSSVMLQIYAIIGIGACVKSQPKLAETLLAKATELSSVFLANKKMLSDVDSLLVADSLNLIGCYHSSLGDLNKATHYNKEAYQLLEFLATNGKPQLLNTNAYGNTVWARLTYNMNIATLENGFEWAKAREKHPMMAYALCLLISALCTPECFYKANLPLDEQLHRLLVDLFSQLETTIETAHYRDVCEGNRTYRKLVDYGLASMKCWLMGNYTQAGEYIEETAIQAALITNPSMEAFVPLYLASFISLQLSQKSQDTFRDLCEIILRALARLTSFRWARSLVDSHVSFFESSLGWSSGITWPEWSTTPQQQSPTSSSSGLELQPLLPPQGLDDSAYNRLG